MKQNQSVTKKMPWIVTGIVMLLLLAVRCLLSWKEGVYFYADSVFDDLWVLRHSYFSFHFQNEDGFSLIKNMSAPLFFFAIRHMGLPYELALTGLYFAAALGMFYAAYLIGKSLLLSLTAYGLTLFIPISFEITSTRLYRMGILPPVVLLLFVLLVLGMLFLNRPIRKSRYMLLLRAFTGVCALFAVYIKEDGIWLIAVLLADMVLELLVIFIRRKKEPALKRKQAGLILAVILPVCIVFGGTEIYKSINYHCFGVREVNTRTEGEAADFMSRIYQIESEDRTAEVWAPEDALEKAIAVSPTLAAQETLVRHILGDESTEIQGDFLGWRINGAIADMGLLNEYSEIQRLFGEINDELDEAFQDGRLQKDDRFQLVSSAGGRSKEEMKILLKDTIMTLRYAVMCYHYNVAGFSFVQDETMADKLREQRPIAAEAALDRRILEPESYCDENLNRLLRGIVRAMGILQTVLLLLACVSFFAIGILWIKKKNYRTQKIGWLLIGMFLLTGIAVVYAVGIAWFSSFIGEGAFVSYGGPLEGILPIVYLFGVLVLREALRIRKEEKNNG